MSDEFFTEKLEMEGGFKQSALRLNKYVLQQNTWGKEQIEKRAEELSEIAKKIWSFPELTETELTPYKEQDNSTQKYTLEQYTHLNDSNRKLFDELNTKVLNLSQYVNRTLTKEYIAYKVNTNFLTIAIQKSKFLLKINIKYADVHDPKGICDKDKDKVKVKIELKDLHELDDTIEIIKQAFKLQNVE